MGIYLGLILTCELLGALGFAYLNLRYNFKLGITSSVRSNLPMDPIDSTMHELPRKLNEKVIESSIWLKISKNNGDSSVHLPWPLWLPQSGK